MAGGFESFTNFSSIRCTRLSFCFALQFEFSSVLNTKLLSFTWFSFEIMHEYWILWHLCLILCQAHWNHCWNLPQFTPGNVKVRENSWKKRIIWSQTNLWPVVSATERGKTEEKAFLVYTTKQNKCFKKSMYFKWEHMSLKIFLFSHIPEHKGPHYTLSYTSKPALLNPSALSDHKGKIWPVTRNQINRKKAETWTHCQRVAAQGTKLKLHTKGQAKITKIQRHSLLLWTYAHMAFLWWIQR